MIVAMITGGMPDMRGTGHVHEQTKNKTVNTMKQLRKRFLTVNWSDGKGEFT
jgi:hypothetical protein